MTLNPFHGTRPSRLDLRWRPDPSIRGPASLTRLRLAGVVILTAAVLSSFAVVTAQWPLALGVAGTVLVLAYRPVRIRIDRTCLPLVMVGSSALLPLLIIGGLPADNYVAALAVPLAAVLLPRPVSSEGVATFGVGAALLALSSIVSSALHRGQSADSSIRFVSYAVLLAVIVRLGDADRDRVTRGAVLVGVVLAGSIYASDAGLLNLPAYSDTESEGERYGGLIGHPNFAAYFLSLCILYLLARRDLPTLHRFGGLAVLGGALLITGSRGAITWLVVAIVLLFPYWRRRALAMGAVVAAVLVTFGAVLFERFAFIENSGGLAGQNSAGWRLGQWDRALALQPSFSLWGVGWREAVNYLPGHLEVHNGYLQIWVELGAVGVLGALVIIGAVIAAGLRRGLPGIALTVFVLGAGLTDPVLFYPPTGYLLIVFLWSLRRRGPQQGIGTAPGSAALHRGGMSSPAQRLDRESRGVSARWGSGTGAPVEHRGRRLRSAAKPGGSGGPDLEVR
ncbi:hypothetical protein GCM10027261_18970 [Geodermatophilus arenarius]|uniref:O-antigen ligase family protein n=1 Tax=Geodermatophilus arenarius TaxID=1137990 RepID=A0ABV9LI63_9ACTN